MFVYLRHFMFENALKYVAKSQRSHEGFEKTMASSPSLTGTFEQRW